MAVMAVDGFPRAADGETATPAGGTAVAERPADRLLAKTPWVTIVWDDPVNLMSYVTHVFVILLPLSQAQGREAHAGGASRGARDRLQPDPRGHGTGRDCDGRVRVVGDPGQGGRRVSLWFAEGRATPAMPLYQPATPVKESG